MPARSGGLGALAFGCGTSELEHVLSTQVIALKKPRRMQVRVEGRLAPHVGAKDVALRIIADIGVAGGRSFAVEFAGAAVRGLPVEGRLTLCNLTIEIDYMGLAPGMAFAGLPVDRVFIGSCTNNRLPDLEAAAAVVRGRRVAPGVTAMVVPGSTQVKRAAEAEGLDRVFRTAGFFWGESGCSMCAGSNGDRGAPGERCVSTTNRNFENRQGHGVRTHLASPATAAAAVAGCIVDVRRFTSGEA